MSLVVRDGVAWKQLPNGMQETADPGECADYIKWLHGEISRLEAEIAYRAALPNARIDELERLLKHERAARRAAIMR